MYMTIIIVEVAILAHSMNCSTQVMFYPVIVKQEKIARTTQVDSSPANCANWIIIEQLLYSNLSDKIFIKS